MLEYFAEPSRSWSISVPAVDPERLRAAVDVEPVPGLVLNLGEQSHFPAEIRGAGDPVALGQHPDHLGVRVLRHHAHELPPVPIRHPVLRLDRLASSDSGLELADFCRIFGRSG